MIEVILIGAVVVVFFVVILAISLRTHPKSSANRPQYRQLTPEEEARARDNVRAQQGAVQRAADDWKRDPINPMNPASAFNHNNPAHPANPRNQNNPANLNNPHRRR